MFEEENYPNSKFKTQKEIEEDENNLDSEDGEGEAEDSRQISRADNGYDFNYFSSPPNR